MDIMCNCHGSHVLRRLLCLCKGVSLDSLDFHGKSSTGLAQRLNLGASQSDTNNFQSLGVGFPDLLKFVVSELVKHSSANIRNLLVNQFGPLVLQAGFPYHPFFVNLILPIGAIYFESVCKSD